MRDYTNKVRLMASSAMLIAASLLPLSSANAETSKKDIQVASKALNFMDPKITGDAEVVVVYNPKSSASAAEADQILAAVGGGLKAGSVTLTAKKTSVTDLAFGGAKMVIVTSGIEGSQAAIKAAADSASIITVSTDAGCVTSGNCVMGVKSSPKVEITINLAATSAANIKFSPAFQMMVKKI